MRAHAAEYVSAMGQLATEAGSVMGLRWLEQQLHDLKQEGPDAVLTWLRPLQVQHPTVALLREKLAYVEKREAHMRVTDLSRGGLADWLWYGRERQQARSGSTAQRSGHALGPTTRQSDARLAQYRV